MMESWGVRLGWGSHKYTPGNSFGKYKDRELVDNTDSDEDEEEEVVTVAKLDKAYRKLAIHDSQ